MTDAANLPDARARMRGPITQQFHQIFNRADLMRAIQQLEGEAAAGDDDGWSATPSAAANLPSEDANRLRHLKRIAADPKGCRRRSIVGSRNMVARIEALSSQMPHFAPVINLVARAALASARTSTPMRLPPILCLGGAGIGKTYTIRKVAEAIGGDFALIAANLQDPFRLRGMNTAWKGARQGRVAEIVLDASTTPVVMVDEFDKAPGLDRCERPYDVWHSLLERENAKSFRDDFLEIEVRADQILWFASANDVSAFPSSIFDRLLILEVPPPDGDQLTIIVASLYARCREDYGGRLPERLTDDVLKELAAHSLRHIARILDLAVGFAAASGRHCLSRNDVQRAGRLAEGRVFCRRGFRGPVGFTCGRNLGETQKSA